MIDVKRIVFMRVATVIAVLAAFVPPYLLLEPNDLNALLDAIVMSIGIAIWWAYRQGTFSWFTSPWTSRAHLLTLGIVCTWAGSVGRLIRLMWWRIFARDSFVFDYWFDHWSVSLTLYLLAVGGSMHILAHHAIDNQIPNSGWVTLVVALAFGVTLGTALIFIN